MKGHGHRLVAALLLLAQGAAACGQGERPAQRQDQQQTAPPSVRYEAHISAGGLAPAGAALRNPHKGDKKTAETGAGPGVPTQSWEKP